MKMNRVFLAIGACFCFAACGGDSGTTTGLDGGIDAGGSNKDSGPQYFALGSGEFKVTSFQAGTDGCQVLSATDPFLNKEFPVVIDNSTGATSVGNGGSFGQGRIAGNVGDLTTGPQSIIDETNSACTYTDTVDSVLTLTATQKFTLFVTETESTRAAVCTPAATTCTSTWTMTLEYSGPITTSDAGP